MAVSSPAATASSTFANDSGCMVASALSIGALPVFGSTLVSSATVIVLVAVSVPLEAFARSLRVAEAVAEREDDDQEHREPQHPELEDLVQRGALHAADGDVEHHDDGDDDDAGQVHGVDAEEEPVGVGRQEARAHEDLPRRARAEHLRRHVEERDEQNREHRHETDAAACRSGRTRSRRPCTHRSAGAPRRGRARRP